ncbi:MAG: GDSL family lipase [Planctomycetes bacterium]|nr:GDSL family lipase [Planctomycetota bacterium]
MKQLQKILLPLTLTTVIALSIAGCCNCTKLTCSQITDQLTESTNSAVKPAPPHERWQKRHEMINERVKQGNVGLLFVGDSITHSWQSQPELWNASFGQWNPVNAGISGDRTQHVLWRLENGTIDGINPKVAVVMIGTNNSNRNDYTAEQIAEGIEAIICTLRTELPNTKVLLLATFPRGDAKQRADKTQDATYNPQWAKNDRSCELASQLADGKMICYLDINQAFLNDEGVLTREVMPDLLHPQAKGYQIWAEAMMPTLKKLMNGDGQ